MLPSLRDLSLADITIITATIFGGSVLLIALIARATASPSHCRRIAFALCDRITSALMPRSETDISAWEEYVRDAVYRGKSQQQIRNHLAGRGILIGRTQFKKRLARWGITDPNRATDHRFIDMDVVERYIEHYFYECPSSDDSIQLNLQEHAGINIGKRRLADTRVSMGLLTNIPEHILEPYEQLIEQALIHELNIGDINDDGRRSLYDYMRRRHGIVGKDRLYNVLRRLNNAGIERRLQATARDWVGFDYQGTDHHMSMDAHCKVEYYGIQIYAAIDCWSRRVMWHYVGISARTAVSVMAQYVSFVEEHEGIPLVLQMDRGIETSMAADAHVTLRRWLHNDENNPLRFNEMVRYCTSKMNQRVEGFWNQLRKRIGKFRKMFRRFFKDGDFNQDFKQDRIALIFIYMPIFRQIVKDWVEQYNCHYIRKQPEYPDAIPGRPIEIYRNVHRYPGARPCGIRVDLIALTDMKRELEAFDLEEYLPEHTMDWCQDYLEMLGFQFPIHQGHVDAAGDRIHEQAYKALRDGLLTHLDVHGYDALAESTHPLDARNWRVNPDNNALFRDANVGRHEGEIPDGHEEFAQHLRDNGRFV